MKINKTVKKCFAISKEHGWWEHATAPNMPLGEDYTNMIAAKLMLMTSELAEALEELRTQDDITKMYYSAKKTFGNGILRSGSYDDVKMCLASHGRTQEPKPEGFPSEIADVVIRVFDLCGYLGIDLEDAIKTKMKYNKSRSYKHGGKAI